MNIESKISSKPPNTTHTEGKIQKKQEIRKFSQEHSSEERKMAAKVAREQRKAHFEQREKYEGKIKELEAEAQGKHVDIARIAEDILAIEQAVSKKKQHIVSELLNFLEIRKLREKLMSAQAKQTELQRELGKIARLILGYRSLSKDSSYLDRAKEIVDSFYTNQGGLKEDIQKEKEEKKQEEEHRAEKEKRHWEEEKSRRIGEAMTEHGAYFVHGIGLGGADDSSLLGETKDWRTKMEIVIALKPALSVSSIREGMDESIWSGIGFVLNAGRISDCGTGDRGTQARSLRKRSMEHSDKKQHIQEKIRDTVMRSGDNPGDKYNEFAVENPDIAGIYIQEGKEETNSENPRAPKRSDLIAFAQEYGIPVYILKNGNFYEMNPESVPQPEEGGIPTVSSEGKKLTIEEIKQSASITDQKRQEIQEKLFCDTPFQLEIKVPEIACYLEQANGKAYYIEAFLPHTNKPGPVDMIRRRNSMSEYYYDEQGVLTTAETPIIKGHVIKERRREETVGGERVGIKGESELANGGHGTGDLRNRDIFFQRAERMIADLKQWKEEGRKEAGNVEDHMKKGASFLYGLAEQAGKMGDSETQQRVLALAEQLLPQWKYKEMMKRRMDSQGQLKITIDDLL